MSDAALEHGILSRRRSWLRRNGCLVAGSLLALTVLALCLLPRLPPAPPDPSEVASMEATLLTTERLKFVVPPDHVAPLLAALEPAGRDWLPANWRVMADLDIRLNDGRTVRIDLYYTSDDRGAFSVHPDYP